MHLGHFKVGYLSLIFSFPFGYSIHVEGIKIKKGYPHLLQVATCAPCTFSMVKFFIFISPPSSQCHSRKALSAPQKSSLVS